MRMSPHRLHRFTRILGTEKKDTNHTNAAQEKSVTIRDICGKTFSRKIRDNPWNLWENILSSSMRRSLPQITQIYTDIGCGGEGHESHGRSTRKICDNPWNLWETFSQAKSVRICGICGKTSLKQRAEESPTDYADLHGYWVQGEGHESHECSTRKIRDNPWNLWETFSQAKSVRICGICGKTSLKQRAEESPTDYADLHGYWVQGEGHESHGYGCV